MTLEISEPRAKLILELERLVGGYTYNPKSAVRARDGEIVRWGRRFRYPLSYRDQSGKSLKAPPKDDWTPSEVLSSHYTFGSNQFEIAIALEAVLSYLEEQHGLDLGAASSHPPKP